MAALGQCCLSIKTLTSIYTLKITQSELGECHSAEASTSIFLLSCRSFLNQCYQKLESLNQFPDFNNYLIFVLTKLKAEGIGEQFFLYKLALHVVVQQFHDFFTITSKHIVAQKQKNPDNLFCDCGFNVVVMWRAFTIITIEFSKIVQVT